MIGPRSGGLRTDMVSRLIGRRARALASAATRLLRGRTATAAFTLSVITGLLLPGPAAAGDLAGRAVVPLAQAGNFVTGVVFDDTKNRDGRFDDNEATLPNRTNIVSLQRVDIPAQPVIFASTDSQGRYRFDALVAGTYAVAVIVPTDFEATTRRQREVTVSATAGATVNFGLARANIDRRFLVGVVFDDENRNGSKDGDEDGRDGIRVTLERVDNTEADRTDTTGGNGEYRFDNLTPGTYVVRIRVPSDSVATNSTRREVTISASFDANEDFGLFRQRAANQTATAVAATSVAVQSTSQTVRAAATSAARQAQERAAATGTARASTPIRTPTPTLGPRRAAAQRLAGVTPRLMKFKMEAVTLHSGDQRVDTAAEGLIIVPDKLSMNIIRNGVEESLVIIGTTAYRKGPSTRNVWRSVDFPAIRREIELLAPLDALRALRFLEYADEGPIAIVDEVPTTYYDGEVNTIALWSVLRPPESLPQPIYREMRLQAWVAREDRIIRAERITANILLPIADPSAIPEPIIFDALFAFMEPERPFNIVPPIIPTSTPSLAELEATRTARIEAAAPKPGAPPGTPLPGAPEAEEPLVAEEPTPEPPPEIGAPSQREQMLAAERALVAIATGGQPRTGSTARGNTILLDVPFRTQQDGTAYAETNAGIASLAMTLGAYGIDVAVSDLRALANGLEGNFSAANRTRIETLTRIAERGGLNVMDLYRGPRFNEWTVEQVRENIRRGFPVVTLVQGAVLPGGTPPGASRERFITIIGIDNDEIIYHDPAYPDEGTGAARRMSARTLEQAWLAASTPRLGAAFSQGPEARGLLDVARVPIVATATPAPPPAVATVPVVGTIEPTPAPGPPEGLLGGVPPLLIFFWLILVILLVAILIRSLR